MFQTFNKRTYIIIVLLVIITMLVAIGVFYKSQESLYTEKARKEVLTTSNFVVAKTEMMLNSLKKTPSNFKEVLENSQFNHYELVSVIRSLLAANTELFGLCTAFERNEFHKDSLFYEPYFYKSGDSLIYTNYSTFPEDYFSRTWYKDAFDANAPVWIEPYADEAVHLTIMASYSIPFYNKQTGKIRGIVTADLFLEGLQKYLASFEILETGYVTMFSREGCIISHPESKYLVKDSMYTLASKLQQLAPAQVFDSVKAGKNGILQADQYCNLAKSTLYYHKLESGWGLVLAFPDDELYHELYSFQRRLIIMAVIALVFIIGGAFIFYYIVLSRSMAKQNETLEALVNARTEQIQKQNQELQVNQFELAEKNEELLTAEEELRQNIEELQTLNENIEEQKKTLHNKNQELNKYFTIIEQSPIAIVIAQIDGTIEYVNPFFTKMTGYSTADVLGKSTAMLHNNSQQHEAYETLGTNIRQGKVWEGELFNQRHDGSELIEKIIIAPIFDQEGNITNIVSLKEDITAIKHTQQQVEQQQASLQLAYKDITDSINYAKTIQNALLTNEKIIRSCFKEHFLLFKPKEIVSGDFYYVYRHNQKIIIAIADCTGHGVPGGFLTMLGITYLHEIINSSQEQDTKTILEKLRARIKETFAAFGSENRNGMDIAICVIDPNNNTMQYSGANNSIYLIHKNKLNEYQAVRNPIGFYPRETAFENTDIQLYNGDVIYLCSDGIQDQFGGYNNTRFSKLRMKNMLLDVHSLPMNEQVTEITDILQSWQQEAKQLDDITMLGIRWFA